MHGFLQVDVVMPQMGGRDLSDALLKKFTGLKVLYTSGYTEDAITSDGVLKDDVYFIQKPYSPKQLAQMVREILDKRG